MKTIDLKTTFYCSENKTFELNFYTTVDIIVAKEALREYNLGLKKDDQLKWIGLRRGLCSRNLASFVSCGAGNTLTGGNDVDGLSFVEWVLDPTA